MTRLKKRRLLKRLALIQVVIMTYYHLTFVTYAQDGLDGSRKEPERIAKRIGTLQCVRYTTQNFSPHQQTDYPQQHHQQGLHHEQQVQVKDSHERLESPKNVSNTNSSGSNAKAEVTTGSGGAQVIVLPSMEVDEETASDVSDFPFEGANDFEAAEELSGPPEDELEPPVAETARRLVMKTMIKSTRKPTLWDHLRKPLKLRLHPRLSRGGHDSVSNMAPRRFKRQVSANQITFEQLIAALLGVQLPPAPPPSVAQNLTQQVLGSLSILVQQLAGALVVQTANDLPVHLANMGLLMVNILRTLTIDNPIIANSPVLNRSRQVAAANQQQQQQQVPRSNVSLQLESTLNLLREVARTVALNRAQVSRSNISPIPAATSTTGAPTPAPAPSTTTSDEVLEEIKFVDRLNEFTAAGDQRQRSNSTSGQRALRRSKRSLGSLLMFGPFSKFYLAMTLNRMLRHQTGMLSQAVLVELVRRFIMPGTSSALSGMFSQLRQSLAYSGHQQQNQQRQNQQHSLISSAASAPAVHLEDSRSPLSFGDTDCHLTSGTQSAGNPLSGALPTFNLDASGLSLNLPSSQTRVTVPSLQTLMGRLNASAANMLGLESLVPGAAGFSQSGQSNALDALRSAQVGTPTLNEQRYEDSARSHLHSNQLHHQQLQQQPQRQRFKPSPYDWQWPGNEQQGQQADLLAAKQAFGNLTGQSWGSDSASSGTAAMLRQASVGQLLELFNQVNAAQRNFKQPSAASGGLGAGNALADAEQLFAGIAADLRKQEKSPEPLSADALADRILNKTLEAALTPNNSRASLDGRLLTDTSELLAGSFGLLLKGVDFGQQQQQRAGRSAGNESAVPASVNSSQPIQITLTADNAASIIERLMSLTGNRTALTDEQPQSKPTDQLVQMPLNQLLMEPPEPDEMQLGDPDNVQIQQPGLDLPMEAKFSYDQSQFQEHLMPLSADRNKPAPLNQSLSQAPGSMRQRDRLLSMAIPAPVIVNGLERHPSAVNSPRRNLSALAPILQPKMPQVPSNLALQMQPSSSPTHQQHKQMQPPKQQQQQVSPRPLQAEIQVSERGQKAQAIGESAQRTSSSSASQTSNKTAEASGGLNNLAMALNMMNMVLLNQKLAANNNSRQLNKQEKLLRAGQVQVGVGGKSASDAGVKKSNTSKKVATTSARKQLPQAASLKAQVSQKTVDTVDPSLSRHRMGSSGLRLNSSLLLADRRQPPARPPANYLFQPLVVASGSLTTGNSTQSGSAPSGSAAGSKTSSSASLADDHDPEHATRWNDVLQHLNLAAAAASSRGSR